MVKCRMCLEETDKSKDFEHLHFHLLKKHGMVSRDYRNRFLDAPLTSSKFREKQKKLMKERRKQLPNLTEKLHAWRHQEIESQNSDVFENPSIDDLEALKEREQYCRMMLGSGIKGKRYRDTYHDLMECRRAIEAIFEQLMRES